MRTPLAKPLLYFLFAIGNPYAVLSLWRWCDNQLYTEPILQDFIKHIYVVNPGDNTGSRICSGIEPEFKESVKDLLIPGFPYQNLSDNLDHFTEKESLTLTTIFVVANMEGAGKSSKEKFEEELNEKMKTRSWMGSFDSVNMNLTPCWNGGNLSTSNQYRPYKDYTVVAVEIRCETFNLTSKTDRDKTDQQLMVMALAFRKQDFQIDPEYEEELVLRKLRRLSERVFYYVIIGFCGSKKELDWQSFNVGKHLPINFQQPPM